MSIDILKIIELAPPFDPPPSISGGLVLYTYGKANISDSLPMYSAGKLSINGNVPLYTTGKGSSSLGVNLYTIGGNPVLNDSLPLFSTGYDPHPNSSLPMFVCVDGIGSFNGSINMFARVLEGGSLDMFCQGPGIPQTDSLLMFSTGIYGKNGSLVMSCPITKGSINSNIPMYTRGW